MPIYRLGRKRSLHATHRAGGESLTCPKGACHLLGQSANGMIYTWGVGNCLCKLLCVLRKCPTEPKVWQNVRKKFPKQLEFAQTVSHTSGDYFPVCTLPGKLEFGVIHILPVIWYSIANEKNGKKIPGRSAGGLSQPGCGTNQIHRRKSF